MLSCRVILDVPLPLVVLVSRLLADHRREIGTSRKGREIDKWYSSKAHEPAGNVQALAAPGGKGPARVCASR